MTLGRLLLKPRRNLVLLLPIFDMLADVLVHLFRHPRTRQRGVVVECGNRANEAATAARLPIGGRHVVGPANFVRDQLALVADAVHEDFTRASARLAWQETLRAQSSP